MLDPPAFDALDGSTQQAIVNANIAEGSALSTITGLTKETINCQ